MEIKQEITELQVRMILENSFDSYTMLYDNRKTPLENLHDAIAEYGELCYSKGLDYGVTVYGN